MKLPLVTFSHVLQHIFVCSTFKIFPENDRFSPLLLPLLGPPCHLHPSGRVSTQKADDPCVPRPPCPPLPQKPISTRRESSGISKSTPPPILLLGLRGVLGPPFRSDPRDSVSTSINEDKSGCSFGFGERLSEVTGLKEMTHCLRIRYMVIIHTR